ncbi:MAG TPA: Glu/Leu/Phe/Val dehydrogenase dimerization domain-containing protein [Cryomorphaceae bacterium]|nr:Glu/Leu/Phe/Val dehydrogenase dimerization domain-containing protein [Cryomorphaceae bacterium]
MKELLKKFEERTPEIVFEWSDPETEAVGWVVINSLRGGAAGGGTRMRIGLDRREVESLAKTMEVKFTVSGPPIGGAKSGINFDPQDPRKHGVLQRWYKAVTPLLKNYYGTGGDLNVDEIHEVIPITEDYGLWHPQEGVVNGHFNPRENEKIHQIGQLRFGVSKVVEDPHFSPDPSRKFVVADLITGYGVAVSVMHHYALRGEDYKGKRAIIQGWGNVGAAAAFYLAQAGISVVGIIDRAGGLINRDGMSFDQVKNLFLEKEGNALRNEMLMSFDEVNSKIWDTQAEIFLPCAASRLITKDQVDRMIEAGMEVIASGANVPFADSEIFFGPIMGYTDEKLSIIPDFISNCGMARVFAYCMGKDVEMSDDAIFSDTSNVIKKALHDVIEKNHKKTNMAETAFEIALSQLV